MENLELFYNIEKLSLKDFNGQGFKAYRLTKKSLLELVEAGTITAREAQKVLDNARDEANIKEIQRLYEN